MQDLYDVASNREIPRPEALGARNDRTGGRDALKQNGAQIFQMRAA